VRTPYADTANAMDDARESVNAISTTSASERLPRKHGSKEYDRKLAEKKWSENPEERPAEVFITAAKRALDRKKALPDRCADPN
jgi:hypothetical protein